MFMKKALVSWAVEKKFRKITAGRAKLLESIEALGPGVRSYNAQLAPVRAQMLKQTSELYDRADPAQLLGFLVYFTAQGYNMTEPVPDWVTRAGAACKAKGYEELGVLLIEHAREEEGHHLMMKRDFESLISFADENLSVRLDAPAIFAEPPSQGVVDYIDLHEDCIKGATPYDQIAIETEIEFVSVIFGPEFVKRVVLAWGPRITKCLSFVTSHTAFDVSHSTKNFMMLDDFLKKDPSALAPLVKAGIAAVDSYRRYLLDCDQRAIAMLARARSPMTARA
jgi:hypothetical protein